MRRLLSIAVLLLAAQRAEAQVAVDVQLTPEGDMLAQQLGITSQELGARMATAINEAYAVTNIDGFIRSFADATAFSMRGLGVDYASDPNSLVLGVGVNLAVAAGDELSESDRPTAGLAANLGFMAGLNLASQGLPRWTIFGNGFYRKGSTSELKGGILSAGLHVQYRLVNPQVDKGVATKALRWTGIDFTGGLELTRWTLGVADDISTDLGVDGTNGSANLVLDSTGTFDLSSTTVTLPVEMSTGIRIALLVSVYVGGALDFTAGKGNLDVNLNGNLVTSDNRNVGTTTITGGGEEEASPFAGRVFVGGQLNLWKLRIYTQLNASPKPLAASFGVGIRGVL